MAQVCDRSINFIIPGTVRSPGVEITATENKANGTITIVAEVMSTSSLIADLRALFFNFNGSLLGLTVEGSQQTDFATSNVIDLGNGANLRGAAKSFDIGVEFGTEGIGKDDIQAATFTLSSEQGTLTLDDIANVQFGARLTSVGAPGSARNDSSKLTTVAPAAPDAIDDIYTIFEDGQLGVDSPSHTPKGQIFQVLSNDTDADGDILTITHVDGAMYGKVEIIDGNDDDDLVGDAILYTPDADYSGADSFTYCISDNNGGTDSAQVDVTVQAVADIPNLSYEIIAGETVNEVIVRVTATQTDADGSEFIDRIELSNVPDNVIVLGSKVHDPNEESGEIIKEFKLKLPAGQSTNFNLGITAYSQEKLSDDEESVTVAVPIKLDHTANNTYRLFSAENQSIWGSGDNYEFNYTAPFAGVNNLSLSARLKQSLGIVDAEVTGSTNGSLTAGITPTFTFNGGEADASYTYQVRADSNYNKTTDVLSISTQAIGYDSFAKINTTGPNGGFRLDFNYDLYAEAIAGLETSLGDINSGVVKVDEEGTWNLMTWSTSDTDFEIPLLAGFGLKFAWPILNTSSEGTTSTGASNDFLQLTLDVDDLIFAVASAIASVTAGSQIEIPNFFGMGFDLGIENVFGAGASYDLIDLDLSAGLNLIQTFSMIQDGLEGIITYEDNTSQIFNFGDVILLENASAYDLDGDGVEYTLTMNPSIDLKNDTNLGFNIGWEAAVLQAEAWVSYLVDTKKVSIGPLEQNIVNLPIEEIDIYDKTFDLNFQEQDWMLIA